MNNYGLDLTGWRLDNATRVVSGPDGVTIIGTGQNPTTHTEAWIATIPTIPTIPEPSSSLLLLTGLLGFAARRRRRG